MGGLVVLISDQTYYKRTIK